ncbi:MAG: CRISPR-associated protein Cas4 [Huintestinicola sp.]|uniref:CRISPR-associated protein Cas4 n=1 Tax=Huintestinicola sp. TaxID=2981661 RepID=UPI003F0310D4
MKSCNSRSVNIRAIQHFLYCPRRFGLLEINVDWAENASVVMGNIIHERVHSGDGGMCRNGYSMTAVTLYNDELDIYGVSDCIEFSPDKNGDYIGRDGKRYTVTLVEYKPTRPKDGEISLPDSVQVFAQKLCADKVFGCNCKGAVYYADVRKRTVLPFDSEYEKYYKLVEGLISQMRDILESGEIPLRKKGQHCGGCSLENVCMPKCDSYSVKENIRQMLAE